MEKAKFKRFSGVFLKLVNLTAVICVVCLLAPVRNSGNPNEQGKSNISNGTSTKSDSPIILLNATITNVESRDSSVLNESEAKTEPESQIPEEAQARPENATTLQSVDPAPDRSDDSESNTEPPRFLAKAICLGTPYGGAGDEWESIEMRVTAYCPCPRCCGEYSDGITACGYVIQPGDTFVAADRRYSFDTEMLIPGYSTGQPVKVLDRGGAIKGNRLDVFFATHEEALEWGVKYLDVQVRRKKL